MTVVGITLALRLPSPHPEAWFLVGYPDSPYHEQRAYWLRPVLWPPAEVVLDHPWAVLDIDVTRMCLDVGTVLACGLLVYLVPGTVLLLPLWEGVGQFAPAPWAALMAVAAARYGTKVSPLLPLFRQEDVVISLVDALERGDLWAVPPALAAACVTPLFNYILLGDPWATEHLMIKPAGVVPIPARDIICAVIAGIPIILTIRRSNMLLISKFLISALVVVSILPGSYFVSAPERYLLPVGTYLMARGMGPGRKIVPYMIACLIGIIVGFSLHLYTIKIETRLDSVHGATFQTFMGTPCIVGNFLAVETLKHGNEVWIPPFIPQRIQAKLPKVIVRFFWKDKYTMIWYFSQSDNNLPKYTTHSWKIWKYNCSNIKYIVTIIVFYQPNKQEVIIWGRKL